MFVKKFPYLNAQQVAELAAHSARMGEVLTKQPHLIFPRPLEHNETSISYAHANCTQPMLARLQAKEVTPADMAVAGAALRALHDAGLSHADFVVHNFFYDGDKLVLIDPHPPEYVAHDTALLYGNTLNEAARFCFTLITDMGIKQALASLRYQQSLSRAFLRAYTQKRVGPLKVAKAILVCTREVYNLKRAHGFTRLSAIAHCSMAFMLTIIGMRSIL